MESTSLHTQPPDNPMNQMEIELQNKAPYKEILRNKIGTPIFNQFLKSTGNQNESYDGKIGDVI